ncbi:MAG: hypothetical protein ABFC24_08595 [Methanoregulaceae archaeon]
MENRDAIDRNGRTTRYLLLMKADRIQPRIRSLIRQITGNGQTAIVISLNQPSKILLKHYREDGIDCSRVFIVDAVTLYGGGVCEPNPNIRCVTSPANLTELGIGIIDILRRAPPGKKCVILDSVSTLLIHAPAGSVTKFLHITSNKLRQKDIPAVFLCLEKGIDPVIRSGLSVFADRIIDLGNENDWAYK